MEVLQCVHIETACEASVDCILEQTKIKACCKLDERHYAMEKVPDGHKSDKLHHNQK